MASPIASEPAAKSCNTARLSSVHECAAAAMCKHVATVRGSAPVAAMTASRMARCSCSIESGEKGGVVMVQSGPKGLEVS